MLCALPPFYHENIDKMYSMIKNSELKFSKRVSISNEAKDLLTKVRKDNKKYNIYNNIMNIYYQ